MIEPISMWFTAVVGLVLVVLIIRDRVIMWRNRVEVAKTARLNARQKTRALDLCDEASYMGLLVTQVPGYEAFAKRLWPTMYFDLW